MIYVDKIPALQKDVFMLSFVGAFSQEIIYINRFGSLTGEVLYAHPMGEHHAETMERLEAEKYWIQIPGYYAYIVLTEYAGSEKVLNLDFGLMLERMARYFLDNYLTDARHLQRFKKLEGE